LGRTHHRNGDCGCEPAHQLTVAARGASFLLAEYPGTEPRFGPSEAGFCYWTLIWADDGPVSETRLGKPALRRVERRRLRRACRRCACRPHLEVCRRARGLGRQVAHGLAFGVDRLSAASGVPAPIRDQAPPQRIEQYLSGLVIAADDEQFLAGRAIPSLRIVAETTVTHVHAIDDGIAKQSAALDDPPAHGSDIVIRRAHATRGIDPNGTIGRQASFWGCPR